MFINLTPLIPLSFEGEGEETLERGEAPLKRPVVIILAKGRSKFLESGYAPLGKHPRECLSFVEMICQRAYNIELNCYYLMRVNMDEEIAKIIKGIQTSMHDQINALKIDAQKAREDSQAALDICAELEQSANVTASDKQRIQQLSDIVHQIIDISIKEATDYDLNFNQLRMLSGMNHLYLHLSVLTLIKLRICSNDPSVMYFCLQPLFALHDLYNHSSDKVRLAKSTDDLVSVGEEFANKLLALQEEIEKLPSKLLDGSESR